MNATPPASQPPANVITISADCLSDKQCLAHLDAHFVVNILQRQLGLAWFPACNPTGTCFATRNHYAARVWKWEACGPRATIRCTQPSRGFVYRYPDGTGYKFTRSKWKASR